MPVFIWNTGYKKKARNLKSEPFLDWEGFVFALILFFFSFAKPCSKKKNAQESGGKNFV